MILLNADKTTDSGALPDERIVAEMGKYNEELAKAGVLLAAERLHPSAQGARVREPRRRWPGDAVWRPRRIALYCPGNLISRALPRGGM